MIRLTEDTGGFYINGRRFDMSAMHPMMTVRAGRFEEWTIENDTDEVHAFHIHQVHFAVTSINGQPSTPRFWRDTVLVPARRNESHALGQRA
jgi:FtsP/CotA-like multicopper oxidase with cupredoxin domain